MLTILVKENIPYILIILHTLNKKKRRKETFPKKGGKEVIRTHILKLPHAGDLVYSIKRS